MSINSQVPDGVEEATRILDEASTHVINTYTEISDMVKSSTSSVRDYLRKLLNLSATSVSFAVVGLLGYAIYKSYKLTKHSNFLVDLNDRKSFLNEPDPDIGKAKRHPDELEEIEKRLDELKLSDDILKQVMEILEDEMEKGLNRQTCHEADLKMLPTYVCQLPTGNESNDILALDLGGSNFRVLLISLRENEAPRIVNKVFIVSESIMKGTGDKVYTPKISR
jgi:hypothetical protein